jgi:Baseplate J-like protein
MAPPTVIYVDNDDEITSAAARLRDTTTGTVALVVPSGSRISTSRINFRLLAREAQTRGRTLAIVAGDAATRALALSAGLRVFASVAEFEASTPEGATPIVAPVVPPPPARPPQAATPTPGRRRQQQPPKTTSTEAETVAIPVLPPPEARPVGPPALVPARPLIRRPLVAAVLALLALGVIVVGVAGYLLLPTATITVTPRAVPIGPLEVAVRADPTATSTDAAAGVVPARRLSFDLSASDTFPVNGRRVAETKATGRVTFRSKDPTRENRIGSGSIVSTSSGIRFRTTATVVVRRATFQGFFVIPGEASVGVEAVNPGPQGNVDANAITIVPQGEDPILTDVRNRNPTTGGTHAEFPRIDQADLDAAIGRLTKQLDQDFEATLTQPGQVPAGLTAFPGTRSVEPPVPSVDPATLLGKEVETFELELTSTGSVTAVDESLVTAVVTERMRSAASAGNSVVDGSVQAEIGEPTIDGQAVAFPVTARASQVRVMDQPALVRLIKGKPLPQARAALEPFGDVKLSVWPDWVTAIPTIDGRIQLRVASPAATP